MAWYRNDGNYITVIGVSLLALVGSFLVAVLTRANTTGCNAPECSILLPNLDSLQKTNKQLEDYAKSITVKVISPKLDNRLLGSGVLLEKGNKHNGRYKYTVVTNAHVLKSASSPYEIETFDREVHSTAVVSLNRNSNGDDVAILVFCSSEPYEGAKINDSSHLKENDEVFVGGFVSEKNTPERFIFTSGRISLFLEKPLRGGYRIGYTNSIRKGMSGAPLLNRNGEVVGINGLHSKPLWDSQELYQDGREVEPDIEKKISNSSMAVPIKRAMVDKTRKVGVDCPSATRFYPRTNDD